MNELQKLHTVSEQTQSLDVLEQIMNSVVGCYTHHR